MKKNNSILFLGIYICVMSLGFIILYPLLNPEATLYEAIAIETTLIITTLVIFFTKRKWDKQQKENFKS